MTETPPGTPPGTPPEGPGTGSRIEMRGEARDSSTLTQIGTRSTTEFEANLIRQRTREGMDIAHQNGKLKVNCFVGEVQRNFDVARS